LNRALERTPIIFCLVGPAASGKSTIARRLVGDSRDSSLILSVSATSRKPRPKEVAGVDYHFLERGEFLKEVAGGLFLEHAEFCGNLYGTRQANLDKARAEGSDLLLDIDLQGLRALKKLKGLLVVGVFLFPNSWSEMELRLRERGTDSEEVIENRLKEARLEVEVLRKSELSDYFVSNQSLEISVANCLSIVRAERLRMRGDLPSETFGV